MKYEFKGTPGPWKKGNSHSSVVSCSLPDDPIMNRAELRHQEAYGGYLIAESIEEKNVHLIAAAPDLLLSAIEILEEFASGGNVSQSHYENLRHAVHKALNIQKDENKTE